VLIAAAGYRGAATPEKSAGKKHPPRGKFCNARDRICIANMAPLERHEQEKRLAHNGPAGQQSSGFASLVRSCFVRFTDSDG